MKLLLTFIIGILCANLAIAEEEFAPFKSEKGNEAAQKFKKSYDVVYERFEKSMSTSRTFAAKQGDIEEIKKIQAVLDGDFNQELTSSTAKTALKSFKTNVLRLCRDYATSLKSALKAELAAGNVEAAEELQPTIEKLEASSKVTKYSPKTFRVEAEKRWQVSDIEVEKGDKVTLYCTGTWTAYKKMPKQDADTNRLLLKVGEGDSKRSGKNSEFIAKNSGKLSFCMDPRLKGKRNSPYGSLAVKVTRTPLDSFQKLHDIALDLGKKHKKRVTEEKIKKEKIEVNASRPDKKKITKKDRKKIRRERRKEKSNDDFIPPPPE